MCWIPSVLLWQQVVFYYGWSILANLVRAMAVRAIRRYPLPAHADCDAKLKCVHAIGLQLMTALLIHVGFAVRGTKAGGLTTRFIIYAVWAIITSTGYLAIRVFEWAWPCIDAPIELLLYNSFVGPLTVQCCPIHVCVAVTSRVIGPLLC